MKDKQHQGCHERVQEDERHDAESKCVAHELIKAGPLLHGVGIYIGEVRKRISPS